MKELNLLSNTELLNLKQDVEIEINNRQQKYLEHCAENATISDEEIKSIMDEEKIFCSLPLADYAKVALIMNAERERLRVSGIARFWPIIEPINPDEKYNILFKNER